MLDSQRALEDLRITFSLHLSECTEQSWSWRDFLGGAPRRLSHAPAFSRPPCLASPIRHEGVTYIAFLLLSHHHDRLVRADSSSFTCSICHTLVSSTSLVAPAVTRLRREPS